MDESPKPIIIYLRGLFRAHERDSDIRLSGEIVDLVWFCDVYCTTDSRGVPHVPIEYDDLPCSHQFTKTDKRIVARAAHKVENRISLSDKEFGKIGPILSCETRNKGSFPFFHRMRIHQMLSSGHSIAPRYLSNEGAHPHLFSTRNRMLVRTLFF